MGPINFKQLKQLLLATLYISTFTFGGGFVIVTLMKKKFVDDYHWIDEEEMLDLVALAQSSPGAIAVNAAILVGWRIQGLLGMCVAVLGTIIPPMVIISLVAYYYRIFASNTYVAWILSGMQAGVAAVIVDIVCELGFKYLHKEKWIEAIIMGVTFIVTFVFKVNVMYIILITVLIGLGLAYCKYGKEVEK